MPSLYFERATAPWLSGVSFLQILNLLGYVIFLVVSSLGGAGKLGASIGSVSNALPTAISPAGWAFSIWSVIFFLTGVLSVVQAQPTNRAWSARKLGLWWCANTIIGEGLWTLAWVGQWGKMWIAAGLLAFIVATNAGLHIHAGLGVAPLSLLPAGADAGSGVCAKFTSILRGPRDARTYFEAFVLEPGIGIYTGWTTAATILNISIALVSCGASPSGPSAAFAGVLVLLAAAFLAVLAAVTRTEFWYAATLAWALAGIRSQQLNSAWPVLEPAVLNAATFSLAISAVAAIIALGARIRLYVLGELRLVSAGEPLEGAYAAV
jgi:hypothetical protein